MLHKCKDSGGSRECIKLQFRRKIQFVQCVRNKTDAGPLGALFREERIFLMALLQKKYRPNMSKHKPTCCACTQLQAGPSNLLTPALPIKTDRSNPDGHTRQTRAPIHYAPWQTTKNEANRAMALAPPPPWRGKRRRPPLLPPVMPRQQPNGQRGNPGCHVAH